MTDRSPKPVESYVTMSHEEPVEQSLVLVIHGQMGAGKTTLASTASSKFPDTLPTERAAPGEAPKYVLDDMAWLSFDPKATAGFRERGVTVPNFDVPHFRGTEDLWKAAKFARQPTIFQAAEFGLQQLLARKPKWLVIDTVSTFDLGLNEYYSKTESSNKFEKYNKIFGAHKAFYNICASAGCAVIFICHSKAEIESDDSDAAAKQDVLRTAAGGNIVPEITGKGKLVYKGAASMQLAVLTKTVRDGKRKVLERYVSPIKTAGHETKNRWELSLGDKEEAHLGKILAKVRQ
jgi:hypothetical protein